MFVLSKLTLSQKFCLSTLSVKKMDNQIDQKKRILKDLIALEKDVDHISKDLKNLQTAIENFKKMPNTSETGASIAEFKAKVSNVLTCMKSLYAQEQKLQAEFENLEDDEPPAAISVMTQQLSNLGCTLNAVNKDGGISFSFDFGKGNTVVVQLENANLSLSSITPHPENFASLKEHLDASQDLLGLLIYYSSLVTNVALPN